MADNETISATKNFVVSVGQTVVETEGQALTVFYQMQSYPELQALLNQHKEEISRALQQKDAAKLIGIIQKVQSDFLLALSEKPQQIQQDTEQKIAETQLTPEEVAPRVQATEQALSETQKTTEAIYGAKKQQGRSFIERLVKNYIRLPEKESQTIVNAIVDTVETHPNSDPKEIIEIAIQTTPVGPQNNVKKLQQDPGVLHQVKDLQKNNITSIEQQIITAILDSPEPNITITAINNHVETNNKKPIEVAAIIENAKQLSVASEVVHQTTDGSMDYSGFFTKISIQGTTLQKMVAPIADVIFSTFSKPTQEAVVLKILGSSWNKDISNNVWLQESFGKMLQTPSVQQAIQKGNALFRSSSSGKVLSGPQLFFADVFTTVFHTTTISETYLQLAGAGNMQMGSSASQYYAGFLAKEGATSAAKKGVKVAGKKVAEKVAGTAIGKWIGGILGGLTSNPFIAAIGAFIGDIVIDKLLAGLVNIAKNTLNFIGNWLDRMMSGKYDSKPLTKDPFFIAAVVLIFAVGLLFVNPLSFFTLGGSSPFQQTVADNALIHGMGSQGGPGGPSLDCLGADKDKPECDLTPCDPSKKDCSWPTYGFIYQGPQSSAPGGACPGTHQGTQSIDIDPIGAPGPVYATIDGTVRAYWGAATNSGCGTCSNANWVIIDGATYSVGYWHLAQTYTVQTGQTVKKGDVIGFMDHTGYSTGTHLHYQYFGSGSINSILPVAIPSCNNYYARCVCPYIVTGGAP